MNTVFNITQINDVASQLWAEGKHRKVWAFNGQMGAGKTTFIHVLCSYIGVTDAVSSPTFALINEYRFADKTSKEQIIYHMDWYRLKGIEEAINAGMEDCLQQPNVYCFVEWPSIAAVLLPMPYVYVDINIASPTERIVTAMLKNK